MMGLFPMPGRGLPPLRRPNLRVPSANRPHLYITKAHPCGGPAQSGVNAEWVEVMNTSTHTASLEGVQLLHFAYDRRCTKTGEEPLIVLTGALDAGCCIRIHSGSGYSFTEGACRHEFARQGGYVWNGSCGETVLIRDSDRKLIDWARYAGKIVGVVERAAGTNELREKRRRRLRLDWWKRQSTRNDAKHGVE